MASPASASIVSASSSPDAAAPFVATSRRRRDSANAGRAETVSNAAASRCPPWPILRSPPGVAAFCSAFDSTFGLLWPVDDLARRFGDVEPLSLVATVLMGIGTHPHIRQPGRSH